MACTLRPFEPALEFPFSGIAPVLDSEFEFGVEFVAWLVEVEDDGDEEEEEGIGWSLAKPK